MIARPLALAALLAAFATTSPARADRCGPDAVAWVDQCAKDSAMPMKLAECPSAVAIVEVSPADGAPLRVEISTSAHAFRRVGSHGLAPIGSFPDWKTEPASTQRAFDAVARCVEQRPPEALLPHDASPPWSGSPGGARQLPLLMIAAAIAALVASPRRFRVFAPALAVLVATFALRRLLQPAAFFHQNGQGPEWIRFALHGDASGYGPGYPEIFGWIATRSRRPDLAVFLAQELLAATVPLSAYAIVRAVRGHRALALAIAIVMACDPILIRVARSESYYSAIVALLFAASALLALADRGARLAGGIAAGLLVAQAARIHPVAWIACAMVPLPIFCRPGRLRDRARRTVLAAALVGAVALPLTVPSMLQGLRGTLGDGLPQARVVALRVAPMALGAVLLAAALVTWRPARAIASRLLVLSIVCGAALASNLLAGNIASVNAAYLHLFLPAALAAGVAMLMASNAPRVAIALVVVAVASVHLIRDRRSTELTTDGHELAWCLDWRETLPPRSEVTSLRRVGGRTLMLPLFGGAQPGWLPFDSDRIPTITRARYYYRGSLCSTPEGSPACSEFESTHRLRPLLSRRVPSRPSAFWLPLPPGEIEVVLFAIE